MTKKTPARKKPTLNALVSRIVRTRDDVRRHEATKKILTLGIPKDEIVDQVVDVFSTKPASYFELPITLAFLAEKNVPHVEDALRPLLFHTKDVVRSNAAEAIRSLGWGNRFADELKTIAVHEAPKKNTSGSLIPALMALGEAKGEHARRALEDLIEVRFVNPWRRGNFFSALAKHPRPGLKPIFRKTFMNTKESAYVRQAAATGLARLGDRTALLHLRQDLKSPDIGLARSAKIQLQSLGAPLRSR